MNDENYKTQKIETAFSFTVQKLFNKWQHIQDVTKSI